MTPQQSDYLKLSTVAVVVYHQVTGHTPDVSSVGQLDDILGRVAHAISALVPVYAMDEGSGECRALRADEMPGSKLSSLAVRRNDMASAIAALKASRPNFSS